MKTKCEHINREYDLFDNYVFTKKIAKLTVPNWCIDCAKIKENEINETYDYKEDILYYKFLSFESDPRLDWQNNTLYLKDFHDLYYVGNDFDPDNIGDELTIIFESANTLIPYEIIELKITYKKCSKETYNKIINKNNELR